MTRQILLSLPRCLWIAHVAVPRFGHYSILNDLIQFGQNVTENLDVIHSKTLAKMDSENCQYGSRQNESIRMPGS
jgi:hypothetical protein